MQDPRWRREVERDRRARVEAHQRQGVDSREEVKEEVKEEEREGEKEAHPR